MAFGITDPALDIANLAQWLQKLPQTNQNVSFFNKISEAIQVDETSTLFYELFSAIMKRLHNLKMIQIEYRQKGLIDGVTDAEINQALNNLSMLFGPPVASSAWLTAVRNHVNSKDIVTLMNFSHMIQEKHALRLIPPHEISNAVKSIDERLAAIGQDDALEPWTKRIINDGLIALRNQILFLRFFGQECMYDQLIIMQSKLDLLAKKEPSEKKRASIVSTAALLVKIAEIYVIPHEALDATKHYLDLLSGTRPSIERSLPPSDIPKELLPTSALSLPAPTKAT